MENTNKTDGKTSTECVGVTETPSKKHMLHRLGELEKDIVELRKGIGKLS
jgi:hypothetical protein